MDKEGKIKTLLDKGLQRCQEFSYKDWDTREVEDLIKQVKTILNELPKDEPPLLSDEKKAELWKQAQRDGSNPYNEFTPDELMAELVSYAQREADIKFYS